MDLSTVKTGSTVNTRNTVNRESTKTKQTKQTADCKRDVAAVVPMDVMTQDVVSKDLVSKDTSTKDPVNHVATQEVRRSRVGQEVLPRSRSSVGNLNFVVLTCCSRFSMFAGCFTLEVAIFFSMIFVRAQCKRKRNKRLSQQFSLKR